MRRKRFSAASELLDRKPRRFALQRADFAERLVSTDCEFVEFDEAIKGGRAKGKTTVANVLFEMATVDKIPAAAIFWAKAKMGWRDQGPAVEIHNQNSVKVEKPSLDVQLGRRKLLADAILVLRSLGVPATVELPPEDYALIRGLGSDESESSRK